jgi:hypothetical protein
MRFQDGDEINSVVGVRVAQADKVNGLARDEIRYRRSV